MTITFWLILLAVLAYGMLHSLLASHRIKALARQWLGPKTDRWYRLGFNFIAVVTLLPILLLPVLYVDHPIYIIPMPWLLISTLIQALAFLMLLISILQAGAASFLGFRQAFLPADNNPPRLVTSGLYHYIRHPMYTAGLLIIWFIPIMTWNLLGLIIGLTVYLFIGTFFEERKTLSEFGPEYAEYQRNIPMLVPRLRLRFRNPNP